jgi:F420-dependent methylenetetrahydromethanopterin dehydrogenase
MPAPDIRSACDAVELALHNADAMRILLSSVAKRARRKELDRATFEAARDLAKAVHPYRD